MSSLLEEAIVDAQALKEAALKNAENAVLERYSGEVKNALNHLLEQDELGLGMGLEEEEPPSADASFLDDVPFGFQNEELDAPAQDELIEIDFDALKARIEEEAAQGITPEPSEMLDSAETAQELAEGEGDKEGFLDIGTEDEQSVIDPDNPALSAVADKPLSDEDIEKAAVEEALDDDEVALTEDMLAALIEELVVDMKPVPQGWASVSSAYSGVEQANNDAMAAAHDAHLEEVEELEEEEETAPDVTHMVYENKLTKLTVSNKELHALLFDAKNQLTQLNLANAKLVYQNKALNSTSLNERQKSKIVEAVQSANSVEEANMIFETIQNAVGISNSTNRSRPQTLREVVQRPTSLLINSKKNNEVTQDPKMDRMLRLAGLNK